MKCLGSRSRYLWNLAFQFMTFQIRVSSFLFHCFWFFDGEKRQIHVKLWCGRFHSDKRFGHRKTKYITPKRTKYERKEKKNQEKRRNWFCRTVHLVVFCLVWPVSNRLGNKPANCKAIELEGEQRIKHIVKTYAWYNTINFANWDVISEIGTKWAY